MEVEKKKKQKCQVPKEKNETNQTEEREKLLTTVFMSANDIWETLEVFGLTESKKYTSYK